MVSRLDTARFEAIIDLLPSDWQKFTPVDMKWLVTYPGRISLAYDEPIVVFGMSIWAIARGSDCVSGELNRGTMEMLLSQPVSRLQVLATHAMVTLAGVCLLAGSAWFGTWSGIHTMSIKEEVRPTWSLPVPLPWLGREVPRPWGTSETRWIPMTEKVDSRDFLPASACLLALGVLLAGISSFVSACDRYRWRTIGIVCGFYVVQVLLKLIGMASESWHWLVSLSFLTAYEPEEFVHISVTTPEKAWDVLRWTADGQWAGLGPVGYDLLLIGAGLLAYVAAALVFQRRDLPAPT